MFKKFGDAQPLSVITPTDVDVKNVGKKMKAVKDRAAKNASAIKTDAEQIEQKLAEVVEKKSE